MRSPRSSQRPSRAPASQSDAPRSAGGYDQEFLYHLYRGSELLQENSVDEAKGELERALKLQPKDIEGQGLLGVVYFRLGLYPRAIEIYRQLKRAAPKEVAPKINLALCYLKTGQTEHAREELERALEVAPEHKRAWGYLGLVFQRFGDFERAGVAFERAGRPKLAKRMAELVSGAAQGSGVSDIPELNSPSNSAPPPSLRPSLMAPLPRPAALPATHITAPAPAGVPSVSVPPSVHSWAQEHELVFPENPRLVTHESGVVLVRIDTSLAVRTRWVGVLCHDRMPFSTLTLRRRAPSKLETEPLGGRASPLVSVIGSGRAVIAPQPGTRLFLTDVDAEPLCLIEQRLIAFEPTVDYETASLNDWTFSETAPPAAALGQPDTGDPPITAPELTTVVRLTGSGSVVAYSNATTHSLEVRHDRPVFVRQRHIVGWLGHVACRAIPATEAPVGTTPMVGFSGHGVVLLDFGMPPEHDSSRL